MTCTIAYLTNRKDCQLQWFLDSLKHQICEFPSLVSDVVVVDFWAGIMAHTCATEDYPLPIRVVTPKPSVWQGPHRLTKENWWSASNARNTALCYAPDGYICYVDDLSVLQSGWLKCVKEAMDGGYVACGTYQKVKKLVVENGVVKSFEAFPDGMDTRRRIVLGSGLYACNGDWLYGCSVAMPVEAALTVNGWPEDLCDGLGSEDYVMGLALGNAGYHLKYDTRMLTLESEEHHHVEQIFHPGKRSDYGVSPNDKSHAVLNIARQSKYFPNSFGEGGIRALREKILNGGEFPIPKSPDREWYTKKLLSEL